MSAMRILIVEDNEQIAGFVRQGLQESGFSVDVAATGTDGYALAMEEDFDAAIVDVMLPGLDGLELIERLRQRGWSVPVLILSARRTVDDRVRGLQSGGDDYLTKPFAFAELLARVQALIRRASGSTEPTSLTAGPIRLDLLTREVTRAGKLVGLQPREFNLLEYLMRNPGRVVTKSMILSHVWDFDFDPQTNVVDVLIHRLRRKIDHNFEPQMIQTVRGVGYVLRVP